MKTYDICLLGDAVTMPEPCAEATLLADVPLLGAGDRTEDWTEVPLIANSARSISAKFSFKPNLK